MADETLKHNLDKAFDPGPDFPDPSLLSRTMGMLGADVMVANRHIRRPNNRRRQHRTVFSAVLTGSSGRLVAGALVLLLLVAAAGVFMANYKDTIPSSLKWNGCGGGFQCRVVKVPLDYANRTGETIDLAIIRKPATDPSRRIGSLLLSGNDHLRQTAASLKNLNARFDLVGFDPRGFGQSAPVRCLSGPQTDSLNAIDTVLDDPQEKVALLQAYNAFVQGCQGRSGRILPFLNTPTAARDMDAIRTALGEDKLTYLGFSRGTFLGEMYANLFPTHVRALALDGVVNPDLGVTDQLLQQAAAYEGNLQAFLADCRAYVGCQLGRAGDPSANLSDLMQRLDQNPMPVGNRILTRQLAIAGVLLGLSDPRNWRSLDTALSNAYNGGAASIGQGSPGGQLLLTLADLFDGRNGDGSYSNVADASVATSCLDWPVPPDVASYDRLGQALTSASPLFGPAFQYQPLVCSYWPIKPKGAVRPLSAAGAPPILPVGATEDPATPYSWAQAVHQQLAGSVLLTRKGYGHTSYDKSLCVRQAEDAYLIDLTLPAPGTVCETDVT